MVPRPSLLQTAPTDIRPRLGKPEAKHGVHGTSWSPIAADIASFLGLTYLQGQDVNIFAHFLYYVDNLGHELLD